MFANENQEDYGVVAVGVDFRVQRLDITYESTGGPSIT